VAAEGRQVVIDMKSRNPAFRMARFRARFGRNPACQRCGGWLYFGFDEHQPTATCINCGGEVLANSIPPLETIETRDPAYYATSRRYTS
jgi:hypothetical protein